MTASSRTKVGWIVLGASVLLAACGGAAAQSGTESSGTSKAGQFDLTTIGQNVT
jgi:hypothetical protein